VSDVFHAKDNAEGIDISRNMRLALVGTDLVQPYVSIFGINNVALSDDLVPSTYHQSGDMCDTSHIVAVPGALSTIIVEWTVGGGLNITETDLWVAKADEIPSNSVCSMSLNDGFEAVKGIFKKFPLQPQTGSGFFSKAGPNPSPKESVSKPFSLVTERGSISRAESNAMGGLSKTRTDINDEGDSSSDPASINLLGPVFRTEVDLSDFELGDRLVFVASATLDQKWLEAPNGYRQPIVGPQSHVANMRTNPDHEFEISGKKLQGRLQWLSIPVTVIVDEVDVHAGGIELFKRLDDIHGYEKPIGRPSSVFLTRGTVTTSFLMIAIWILLSAVALVMLFLVVHVLLAGSRRRWRRGARNPTANDGVMKSFSFTNESTKGSGKPIKKTKKFVDQCDNTEGSNDNCEDLDQSIHSNLPRNVRFSIDPNKLEKFDENEQENGVDDFESKKMRSTSYPSGCSGGVV
jgi:hypothetical protein